MVHNAVTVQYTASGFFLTQINPNKQIMKMPDGTLIARKTLDDYHGERGRYGSAIAKEAGAVCIPGFQLRYIYFLNPAAKERLTVPILPFSKIEQMGAGMYKGVKRGKQATGSDQEHSGGAAPTVTLQNNEVVT